MVKRISLCARKLLLDYSVGWRQLGDSKEAEGVDDGARAAVTRAHARLRRDSNPRCRRGGALLARLPGVDAPIEASDLRALATWVLLRQEPAVGQERELLASLTALVWRPCNRGMGGPSR